MNIPISQIYLYFAIFSLILFILFTYFERPKYKKIKPTVIAFSMLESVSLVSFNTFLGLTLFKDESDRQGCIIMAVMLTLYVPTVFFRRSRRENLTCWDKNQILLYSLLSFGFVTVLVYNNLFI